MSTITSISQAESMLAEVRHTLAQSVNLDEIQDLRDTAEAIHHYIKVAKIGLDMQNQAAEVKLYCERRAGQILKGILRRGGDHKSEHREKGVTLSDLGVDKWQSSRWQREGSVTDEDFAEFVQRTREEGKELTSQGLIRFARNRAEQQKPEADDGNPFRRLTNGLRSLERQHRKFACIYADPPWSRLNRPRAQTSRLAGKLALLPVAEIAAREAHLHLWVTPESLEDGLKLLRAWSFRYKASLVRPKVPVDYGRYWRQAHDTLLLGVRGALEFRDSALPSWIGGHLVESAASEREIHDLIERVSPAPYLDLFGTASCRGWAVAAAK